MPIKITDGRAIQSGPLGSLPVPYKASPNVGGVLKKPRWIVLHDTASGLSDGGPISWLTNPVSKVSAHVVIGRDGKITQLVPFGTTAWHAGESTWNGVRFLNSWSIGIEIVNPGKLQRISEGVYKGVGTYDTNRDRSLRIEHKRTNPHGEGYWLAYTSAQIAAVTDLCKAMAVAYPIEEVLTHWLISPGRKIDTNPLFPLEQVRAAVRPAIARPIVKPVAIADLTGGEDDTAAGSKVSYEGEDYHAPVSTPDTDESAGGSVGFFKRGWNWFTGLASGGGVGVLGALTNKEVAFLFVGAIFAAAALAFLLALWLYGKQNVGAWIARKIA